MDNHVILMPSFLMVFLTFVVWVTMYKTRVAEIRDKRIHPQELAKSKDAKELLIDSASPANNFINLFEIPVLFYTLNILVYVTGQGDDLFLILLGGFVASRYIHSYIQITYNQVMHRFKVYVAGASLVWIGWGVLAWRLFA